MYKNAHSVWWQWCCVAQPPLCIISSATGSEGDLGLQFHYKHAWVHYKHAWVHYKHVNHSWKFKTAIAKIISV